ncbi:hypothetical protein B0F90DRAFT_1735358 [Multifurca ochricompacta]|uniref:Uncharacterized protein n=1 Tax=Multifurca ochricompacta TaxID=376703 RepID=A0AAD4QMB7_9AGAM|nr:hypothetical protein B0F90DRAFT_1735358 [Multifurca ochricompacta]
MLCCIRARLFEFLLSLAGLYLSPALFSLSIVSSKLSFIPVYIHTYVHSYIHTYTHVYIFIQY